MIKSLWFENKQINDDSVYPMTLHKQWEINFMLTDGVDVFINNTLYTSKRGDIFIIPPYLLHRANYNRIKYDRFLIIFDDHAISEIADVLTPALQLLKNIQVNVVHLNTDELNTMVSLFNNAFFAQIRPDFFSDFNVICAFGKILSFIIDKINLEECLNPTKKNDDEVTKILTYISQNIDSDLTIPGICKKFDISKSTLWNIMKKNTGLSMKEFILNLRISRAIDLLLRGASVTETSNQCGFNSYAHFIRTFTKTVGTSPHQYRKKHISQM